jgi:hypothetical protein
MAFGDDLTPYVLVLLAGLGWSIRELYARARRAERQLTVDWVDLFQSYYRIWSHSSGLETDLQLAIEAHPDGRPNRRADEDRWKHFSFASLYHHACMFSEVERFVADKGGLWILSSYDVEVRMSDAAVVARWGPFTLWEESWLAEILDEAGGSARKFAIAIDGSPDGRRLLAKWRSWIAGCECLSTDYDPSCAVHKVVKACATYQTLCDEEWQKLAPWYRSPRSAVHVDLKQLSRETQGRSYPA